MERLNKKQSRKVPTKYKKKVIELHNSLFVDNIKCLELVKFITNNPPAVGFDRALPIFIVYSDGMIRSTHYCKDDAVRSFDLLTSVLFNRTVPNFKKYYHECNKCYGRGFIAMYTDSTLLLCGNCNKEPV